LPSLKQLISDRHPESDESGLLSTTLLLTPYNMYLFYLLCARNV